MNLSCCTKWLKYGNTHQRRVLFLQAPSKRTEPFRAIGTDVAVLYADNTQREPNEIHICNYSRMIAHLFHNFGDLRNRHTLCVPYFPYQYFAFDFPPHGRVSPELLTDKNLKPGVYITKAQAENAAENRWMTSTSLKICKICNGKPTCLWYFSHSNSSMQV